MTVANALVPTQFSTAIDALFWLLAGMVVAYVLVLSLPAHALNYLLYGSRHSLLERSAGKLGHALTAGR